MNCLYCGKDIGTLRLLRDSEFCSAPHRKSYKERLGRVLNKISEEHEPPPPLAGFRTAIPPQEGNAHYTMLLWQYGGGHPMREISAWPLAVPELVHQQPRTLNFSGAVVAEAEPTPILDLDNEAWVQEAAYPELDLAAAAAPGDAIQPLIEFEQAPPVCDIFSVMPDPEITARWLESTLSDPCARVIAPVTPAFPGLLPAKLPGKPAPCGDCQPVPPAEPVTAWMMNTGTLSHVDFAATLRLGNPPALPAALRTTPAPCREYLPVPAAEPVTAWIAMAVAITPLPVSFEACVPAPLGAIDTSDGVLLSEQYETPAACERYLPAPAAEPVAAWIATASAAVPMSSAPCLLLPAALDLIHPVELPHAPERQGGAPSSAEPANAPAFAAPVTRAPALPSLPALTIAAELEPLPIPDDPLEIPAMCGRLMSSPAPEPVWSFLTAASASELAASIPQSRPTLADYIPRTHVPRSESTRRIPQAEPVMAGVWPRIAETPIERIDSPLRFRLPEVPVTPALPHVLVAAAPVPAPAAEPVAAIVVSAHAAVPAAGAPALALPPIASITATANTAWLAPVVAALAPQPVETFLIAASADAVVAPQAVALLPFELEGAQSSVMAITDAPPLAASAAVPAAAAGKPADLQLLASVGLKLPEQRHQRTRPAIPQPGLVALEYHTQRMRGVAFERPEWKTARFEPIPPRFALHAALENLEGLTRPKAPLPGVFPITARTPRVSRSAVMEHILRVAAAVLIVATMWVGANGLKNARRVNVRQEDTAFATPNRVLTPESQRAATSNAEGKGPANWLRHTIANRASVQVAEDFQGGMQKWGAPAGALPANWRRSPDGYVQTGLLALFAPTAKYTDYKLEFFGQIDNKSLGWVIRAKDEKNYHAMKFTTLENGLRPIIAMVHYTVINGVAGRRTQTPLNVMVHHNRPFQVAVTVHGKHLTTELDGEEVDTFREDVLTAGGVGFFSDAGEHARLYWARVTKNDDWLGHVCAFLSGGESQATAELWPPAVPGGAPAPWTPGSDSSILTAAWIGLPSIRRTHSLRRQKKCK